jgi:hypothetical protein
MVWPGRGRHFGDLAAATQERQILQCRSDEELGRMFRPTTMIDMHLRTLKTEGIKNDIDDYSSSFEVSASNV